MPTQAAAFHNSVPTGTPIDKALAINTRLLRGTTIKLATTEMTLTKWKHSTDIGQEATKAAKPVTQPRHKPRSAHSQTRRARDQWEGGSNGSGRQGRCSNHQASHLDGKTARAATTKNDSRKPAWNSCPGSAIRISNAAKESELSKSPGRSSIHVPTTTEVITAERTAEGCQPVAAT
jgi:hypothetical protein